MRGKTMFFVNWPHEQQKLAAFFNALCVKFLRIPPGASQEEVQTLLAKWNDPNDEHECFILSTKTAALGLNLHHACHRLVVYSIPENINTLIQVIGRVHRIGQKKIQYIWNLSQDCSYDQIMRAKSVQKFLLQVLGDSAIKDFSDDTVRRSVLAKEYQAATATRSKGRPDKATVEEHFLNWQVQKMICHMLGFRAPPYGWDNTDLTFKTTLASHRKYPCRVRVTMPHEIEKYKRDHPEATDIVNTVTTFSMSLHWGEVFFS